MRVEKLTRLVEAGAIARAAESRQWSDAVCILWFALSIEPRDVEGLADESLDKSAIDLINYAMQEGPRPAWYRDAE